MRCGGSCWVQSCAIKTFIEFFNIKYTGKTGRGGGGNAEIF